MKLFLTASAEVRARRRLAELISRGMVASGDLQAQESTYHQVLQVKIAVRYLVAVQY